MYFLKSQVRNVSSDINKFFDLTASPPLLKSTTSFVASTTSTIPTTVSTTTTTSQPPGEFHTEKIDLHHQEHKLEPVISWLSK